MIHVIRIAHIASVLTLLFSILIFIKAVYAATVKNHKIRHILYTHGLSQKNMPNHVISLIDCETGKLFANIDIFPCIVGKGRNADVAIPNDRLISNRHLVFTYEKDLFFIQDLQSANGTRLNDKKLTSKRAIRNEDRICIGQTTFKILIKRKTKYENHKIGETLVTKNRKIS